MTSESLSIVLLDTDVFSYLMEPGDPRGQPYLRHVEGRITALAFITVGESVLRPGDVGKSRGWQAERGAVAAPLDQDFVPGHFDVPHFAKIGRNLRKKGQIADGCLPFCRKDRERWGVKQGRHRKRLPAHDRRGC